jgi:UTP:GlnB (protein PII) uridylyltransferase
MDEKLYITKKDILTAYKTNTLEDLFNEKIKLLQQVEKAKEAKKKLFEMMRSQSNIELLLKMLEDNDK